MRTPKSLIAATVVALLGVGGLVRAAIPLPGQADTSSSSNTSGIPIQITGAYVRQPLTLVNAATYFSVTNNTATADVLSSVLTGAGAVASLHTESGATMKLNAAGLTIPARSTVRLSPGVGHVMIEKLYGPLAAGQTVNLQLTFDHAGSVIVTAPVIGINDPVPTVGGHN